MNGTRTASEHFGDFVAEVMQGVSFVRGIADTQLYSDAQSQAANLHVDEEQAVGTSGMQLPRSHTR